MPENEQTTLWGIDVSPLVPDQYAVFRPLVADALTFFVRHLDPARLALIVHEQHLLPGTASLSQRLASFLQRCPTLHKLGQVIARDRRLAPELRSRLQALESMPPVQPMSLISTLIRRELDEIPAGAMRLGAKALAEASVAVVVPFSLALPSNSEPISGVFKILKPGIEEHLAEELEIWSKLGVFIDERCEHHGLPALHYADTLETVRELLPNEIKLDQEQRHLEAAAQHYATNAAVKIPKLLPFSTARLTAMEHIQGKKVTQVADLSQEVRDRLAATIIEALVAQPVWSNYESGLFHADPHAGNLLLTEDQNLAILDWSLVGHLAAEQRIQVMQLMLGALSLDVQRIIRAIAQLGQSRSDEVALRGVVEKALDQVYKGRFPGYRWLLDVLDQAMLLANIRFSRDLLLFRKSVLTLEGVIADISLREPFDRVMTAAALRQLSLEWGDRVFALPSSRAFGSHISNLDLMSLYFELPATISRFWQHHLQQWLLGSGR